MTTVVERTHNTITMRYLLIMLDAVQKWLKVRHPEREIFFDLGEPQTFKDSASGMESVRYTRFIWRRTEYGAYCEQLNLEVWQ